MKRRKVYFYAQRGEAMRVTGKEPIGVGWVDTDKGNLIRSRLVAKEFRRAWQQSIFAGTPPLEVLRLICGEAAKGMNNANPICLMLIDIKRAHFYATAKRRVFVKLPPEDPHSREGGVCVELAFSMYGTLDVAANWEETYTSFLEDIGFVKGVACPCVFYSAHRWLQMLAHGDDFLVAGTAHQLEEFGKQMAGEYEFKQETIGPHDGMAKELKVIGR